MRAAGEFLGDGMAFDGLIADKAFDSNALVAELNDRGARIAYPSTPPARRNSRSTPASMNGHLIENFFCKLKEFKRVTMRACKTDQSFEAMIYLAAAVINSR